jgi:hypothetical protein
MKAKMESNQASLAVIGIDIGKEVFHIVGLGVDGKIAFRRKIRRLGRWVSKARSRSYRRALLAWRPA